MERSKYFVTGATGFLGSHIVRLLLEQGKTVVCLVRASTLTKAEHRLISVLRGIPSEMPLPMENLRVVRGSVVKPGLGISDTDCLRDVSYFIHAAADVNLTDSNPASSLRTNCTGAEHALGLAHELSIPYFLHISTAYVSGRRAGLIMESFDEEEREFNNHYERSKALAEGRLIRHAGEHGMNLAILRPSIIVGDSRKGYIPRLNSIYNFLIPLARLRVAADSGRLRNGDSRIRESGEIHVPVPVGGTKDAKLNLVPVDYVAETVARIAESGRTGVHCYHIVDNDPFTMGRVIEHISTLLNISGIELMDPGNFLAAGEEGLGGSLFELNRMYMGYMSSQAYYDTTNVSRVLNGQFPYVDKGKLLSGMIGFTKKRVMNCRQENAGKTYEDIERYFEEFLGQKEGQRLIKNLNSFSSCFEIAFSDIPLDPWTVTIEKGILASVTMSGGSRKHDCRYRVSSSAFRRITRGEISPQECFFRGDVDIDGDVRHGLKLASLMEIFLREHAPTSCIPKGR